MPLKSVERCKRPRNLGREFLKRFVLSSASRPGLIRLSFLYSASFFSRVDSPLLLFLRCLPAVPLPAGRRFLYRIGAIRHFSVLLFRHSYSRPSLLILHKLHSIPPHALWQLSTSSRRTLPFLRPDCRSLFSPRSARSPLK